MGYTHYFTQLRDFTVAEWNETIRPDIEAILKDVERNQGIPLANANGDLGTSPEINKNKIWFNGAGEGENGCHETFSLNRVRPKRERWQTVKGSDSCKTARKPYDLAVTACLAYLATVAETHRVSSDGFGTDWLDGVAEARRALPKYSNILDIPMPIMQSDRWITPWVSTRTGALYQPRFCIDGHGYVIHEKTGKARYFATHLDLANWLKATQAPDTRVPNRRSSWGVIPGYEENIWNAYGSFDEARHIRIGALQNAACFQLFETSKPGDFKQPPAYARPNTFPPREESFYSFTNLLTLAPA